MVTKVGMTQIFDENGTAIPVTVVESGPNIVLQKKTVDTDGYNALQMGLDRFGKSWSTNRKPDIFKRPRLSLYVMLKNFVWTT
jgi:large subunit ribosomal protein L3